MPSGVVAPCDDTPRCSVMALTILSLPQPPSWHGVYVRISVRREERQIMSIQEKRMTYGSTYLDKVLSDWLTVVHGIKGSNLVYSHGWHFQHACNLVHHADAGISVLPLSKVQ